VRAPSTRCNVLCGVLPIFGDGLVWRNGAFHSFGSVDLASAKASTSRKTIGPPPLILPTSMKRSPAPNSTS
jgi:hypothetical protein